MANGGGAGPRLAMPRALAPALAAGGNKEGEGCVFILGRERSRLIN